MNKGVAVTSLYSHPVSLSLSSACDCVQLRVRMCPKVVEKKEHTSILLGRVSDIQSDLVPDKLFELERVVLEIDLCR